MAASTMRPAGTPVEYIESIAWKIFDLEPDNQDLVCDYAFGNGIPALAHRYTHGDIGKLWNRLARQFTLLGIRETFDSEAGVAVLRQAHEMLDVIESSK